MGPNRSNRTPATGCVLAFCTALALQGCASSYTLVPPRLDLQSHGTVALVSFSAQGNERLATLATERFAEVALANQPGVELVELDAADLGLAGPVSEADGKAIADAVRGKHDVGAVFVGELTVSGVKPRGGLGGIGSAQVGADVDATLAVRLVSARSGATVWRARSAATAGVGHASATGRFPSVSVRDPNEAYAEAVNEAVVSVTRDLRPTRVRQ
jgi:hypothetical protein